MEHIDKIIFINLESRKDRLEEFYNEIDRMEIPREKVERFDAVCFQPNYCACTQSHINVLKLAKERGYKNILIFEDDFQFIVSKEEFNKNLTDFFNIPKLDWNVVMLSYNLIESTGYNSVIGIAREVQTASGYIVNSHFFNALINNLSEALYLLTITGAHWIYMNDQYWKLLQKDNKWFYFLKRIGIQRSGYSDLAGKNVEYKV